MTVRTRFAPSPTGSMHIGNVRTAAFAWLFARRHGGAFILRIEDTDRTRYVEGSVEEIMRGLEWLGLNWDEGPYFQSERLDIYSEHALQLIESGKAYRCWCTPERLDKLREEQRASGKPTGYDRHCRESDHGRSVEEPHVIRFAMPLEGTTSFDDEVRGVVSFENALIDDFVMIKADGYPTYQFANVVDDHLMQITHVIRSEEWVSSTPKHVQLYRAFGWETPQFVHPPLILGPDKSKLSKRHGAVSFAEFIQKGYLPDGLLNFMALLGWSPGNDLEVMPREQLISLFDISGMVNHPAVFDIQKLDWINRQHIRLLKPDQMARLVRPYLDAAGLSAEQEYLERVCVAMQERLQMLPDIVDFAGYFFTDEFEYEEKGLKHLGADAVPLFEAVIPVLDEVVWNEGALETAIRSAGESVGLSGGKVIHPIRMAATGRTVGPSLFTALEVLGRERVISRIERARILASGV